MSLSEKFFVTSVAAENTVLSYTLVELSEPQNAELLLREYAPMLGTEDMRAAAAFFCSWYAGVCGAMHSMLAAAVSKAAALQNTNMSVQLSRMDGMPLFSFRIHEGWSEDIPAAISAEAPAGNAQAALAIFYRDEVRPIVAALSQASKTPAALLWKQIYNSLYDYMEDEAMEAANEESQAAVRERFRRWTWDMEPEIFGLRRNPFRMTPKFMAHPSAPDQMIFVKATCCLAYRLAAFRGYCGNCPIVQR
ncbi:(2Fe-2S)-binding protein [Paenibacillus sp. FSL H8-0537]|uniref:(2Fe-2S)-binding protein n=1 Tax=Paenibacillus sp. FSL H8-0537 TaxID=2921399 RepID=UPI003100D81E